MTTNEIMVVVVCLLLGYWVISALMGGTKSARSETTDSLPQDQPIEPWHNVLGVQPSASLDEVQFAYRTLIRQYHPDKVNSMGPELVKLAEEKTSAVNRAYDEALRVVGARQ